jgi:uracil-DNA glycosylase family 4
VRQEVARVEAEIALCVRCYGAEPRWPVRLERPAGRGRVLILGERPPRETLVAEERLGLSGRDASTRMLRELVREAGIPESELFVGAALLCRPQSRALEAAVPRRVCLFECSAHVRELVRAAQPRLVVPLGAAAVRSVALAFPEQRPLAELRFPGSVGQTVVAGATYFHPLYHVSARARVTRPEAVQRQDWRALGRLWEWIAASDGDPRSGPPPPPRESRECPSG